jgi:hypothetical protein
MHATQAIIREATKTFVTIDAQGRRLTLRRLAALDTLRLFKAAGPLLAQNEPWLSLAGLAFAVVEIDGIPVPPPTTEPQIENLIDRLGDDGLAAIVDSINAQEESPVGQSEVGNLPGTLS